MSEVTLHATTDADFRWLLGEIPATRPFAVAPDLAPMPVLEIVRGLSANWLMVVDRELVGIIGLKADAGDIVEIGYGVAASRHGRGFASAGVAHLLTLLAGRGVRTVRAETSVANPASQRVLERNGFDRTGERIDDEDGALHLWRKTVG